MKKLRVWDSEQLGSTFVTAAQIKQRIEQLYVGMEVASLKDLPNSMVPTELLYELVVGFGIMYNNLTDYDLLRSGNNKQNRTNPLH